MYVFSNTVKTENCEVIGTFSSHGAALIALTHISNPSWQGLFNQFTEADKIEEEKMMQKIDDMRSAGEVI